MTMTRREMLAVSAAAVAGAVAAPGLRLVELAIAKSPEEAVTALHRWGMLIDAAKCNDCDACVSACRDENGWQGHNRPATDAQWIRKVKVKDRETGYVQEPTASCWSTSTSASGAATA